MNIISNEIRDLTGMVLRYLDSRKFLVVKEKPCTRVRSGGSRGCLNCRYHHMYVDLVELAPLPGHTGNQGEKYFDICINGNEFREEVLSE